MSIVRAGSQLHVEPESIAKETNKSCACSQQVVELTADAISESIKPDLSDETVQAFDVAKPFTYQLVFDFQPTLTWKQPYKGMKVRRCF